MYKVLMETFHINALQNFLADLKRVLENICQDKLSKVMDFHINKKLIKFIKRLYKYKSAYNRKCTTNVASNIKFVDSCLLS